MTLFDECREALSADFNIVEGLAQQEALGILNKYILSRKEVLLGQRLGILIMRVLMSY